MLYLEGNKRIDFFRAIKNKTVENNGNQNM